MFLTLIVTLTAATVDGFPQLAVLHPQYQVPYLPVVPLPKRSLNYYGPNIHVQKVVVYESNPGGFQSDTFPAPPEIRNHEVYARLTAEPNSAFVKREFANQYGTSKLNVGDNYTGQRSGLRARSGFESGETSSIYTPTEYQTENSLEGDEISINVVKEKKPDYISSKPRTEPESSFTANENAQQDGAVRYRKKNINTIPNTTLDDGSRNLKSRHFNSPSDMESINEQNINSTESSSRNTNNEVNNVHKLNNDSANDANMTFITQKDLVQDVNALNGKTGNPAADVENSMQAPASSNAPEETENNSFVSRGGLRSSGNTEEEDKWIWNVTEKVETTTPDIENRVSFDGDACPTGKVRVAGMCVKKD